MPIPQLSDSSKSILELLWEYGEMTAKDIALRLSESKGYTKGTTYKLLDRLIQKGFILKKDPSFLCSPMFTRDVILANETKTFLDRFFEGSFQNLVAELIDKRTLSEEDVNAIRKMIDERGDKR